jgi:ABC-type glutathione transport system ATPase component
VTALHDASVPPPGRITAGRIVLDGTDLLTLPEHAMRRLRGRASR